MPRWLKWVLVGSVLGVLGFGGVSFRINLEPTYQVTGNANGVPVKFKIKGSEDEVFTQATAMLESDSAQAQELGAKFIEMLAVNGHKPAYAKLVEIEEAKAAEAAAATAQPEALSTPVQQ